MSTTRERLRRAGWAALAAGSLMWVAGPATAAQAVRTDTSLGGYKMLAIGAPLSVLFDDEVFPIPRDPGAPLMRADESYTQTSLSTGPQARALASSLWPGPLVGDGLPTITNGAADYGAKADARYPAGPQEAAQSPAAGAGMQSVAKGLDVRAHAGSGSSPATATAGFGNVESTSVVTVTPKGVATSTVEAAASNVSLLAGLIQIKSVRTDLLATSDGRKGVSTGSTTVDGLTVAGTGYTVDEKGARPVSDGKPSDSPVPPPATPGGDQLSTLGITIAPVTQEQKVDGSSVTRVAGGLRITVEGKTLHRALNSLPYQPVLDALPQQVQGELYFLLALSPKITYILGNGSTAAAANLPITFSFPNLPVVPPVAPPVDDGSTGTDTAATAGDVLGAGAAEVPGPAVDSGFAGGGPTGPVLAGVPGAGSPELTPLVALPPEIPPGFGGIGVPLLLFGLFGAGVVGRGLVGLQALALAGGTLGSACTLGAPTEVPDLRGD